jgi:hypothetical protein
VVVVAAKWVAVAVVAALQVGLPQVHPNYVSSKAALIKFIVKLTNAIGCIGIDIAMLHIAFAIISIRAAVVF